ncbi:MAG: flagellar basal body rod protein FlgB [Halobacteriovoraceae bacterium]|nr:flagellar basal body rod protein FlgB [Halobacteriovoraceae bacterium]|tara:strand:+ start:115 stop:522 length:408 start_codon:yes stop_codon:yes gene_type:complete
MSFDDKTIDALATSLNFRQMRQEIISSNIANSETPGYKAKRIQFEEALARALDVDGQNGMNTNKKEHFNFGGGDISSVSPEIYEDPNGEVSENGNTVDRDKEMALMAENKILYDAAIQLLNKKLSLKKYILNSER